MPRKYNAKRLDKRIDICDLVQGSIIILPGMEKAGSFEVREKIRDTVAQKYHLKVRQYGTILEFRYSFNEYQTFEDGK